MVEKVTVVEGIAFGSICHNLRICFTLASASFFDVAVSGFDTRLLPDSKQYEDPGILIGASGCVFGTCTKPSRFES